VPPGPALAIAGIANPHAFFAAVRAAGCAVTLEVAFRDHYRYSSADVERIAGQARDSGAATIITTEKDLVRLLPFRPFPMPIVGVPMTIEIDDSAAFDAWLSQTIARARA
jgi:tetraacyldisaccharide 4'-kinase